MRKKGLPSELVWYCDPWIRSVMHIRSDASKGAFKLARGQGHAGGNGQGNIGAEDVRERQGGEGDRG